MNLTYKILDFLLHKIGHEVIEKSGVFTILKFYIEKDIEVLFGKEPLSSFVLSLKNETYNALPFLFNKERYTFYIEDNHLILKKNFNEIVFRITINEHYIHNFVLFQVEDKIIRKYQKVNLKKERKLCLPSNKGYKDTGSNFCNFKSVFTRF